MWLAFVLICSTITMETYTHELTLLKECGETECSKFEYCFSKELVCRSCEDICEINSANYQRKLCESQCQDYVHDIVYGYGRLREVDINNIYVLLTAILLLVILLVLMVGGILLGIFYRYIKQYRIRKSEDRKFQEKLSAVQYTISNNNNLPASESVRCISQPSRSVRQSIISLTTQTETLSGTNRQFSSSRTLPLSTEEPTEDMVTDFTSYYNQAMSHSPLNTNTSHINGNDSSSNENGSAASTPRY